MKKLSKPISKIKNMQLVVLNGHSECNKDKCPVIGSCS